MIPEFGSRLGLICVVILIQSCSAHPDLPKLEQLQSVLDEGSTRPTWEMVQEAAKECEEWEKSGGQTIFGSGEFKKQRLLSHSILYPFLKYSQSTDVNERDSFLDKLFATYNMFWPYYVAHRKVPGETVGTSLCHNFYEAMRDEQKEKKLTIKDFRNAVEEIKEIRLRATEICRKGELPFRHSEGAALYNALLQNNILTLTSYDVEEKLSRRESVTIDEIKEIFKERMEKMRKKQEEEEKEQIKLRWIMEVEKRQRQSEEAANTLDQIEEAERLRQVEGPNKRKRIERPNDPNPSEEAGPSGQS